MHRVKFRNNPSKVELYVTADELPDNLVRIERSPDLTAIKEAIQAAENAGQPVNYAALVKGRTLVKG